MARGWKFRFRKKKFRFRKKRNCTIRVAKTKVLISFTVTAPLFSHMQIVGFLVQWLECFAVWQNFVSIEDQICQEEPLHFSQRQMDGFEKKLSELTRSVYPSVCRTDGYGTDRRLQEHALFRAKNVFPFF